MAELGLKSLFYFKALALWKCDAYKETLPDYRTISWEWAYYKSDATTPSTKIPLLVPERETLNKQIGRTPKPFSFIYDPHHSYILLTLLRVVLVIISWQMPTPTPMTNDAVESWEDELTFIDLAESKCFWAI